MIGESKLTQTARPAARFLHPASRFAHLASRFFEPALPIFVAIGASGVRHRTVRRDPRSKVVADIAERVVGVFGVRRRRRFNPGGVGDSRMSPEVFGKKAVSRKAAKDAKT